MDKPERKVADKIINTVEHSKVEDIKAVETASISETVPKEESWAENLASFLSNKISSADLDAATERVETLRANHPSASDEALVEMLIKAKCRQTAAVGAATSAVALIPGFGTLASLTVGLAIDIGATFKLQAELVLEIAEVYQYPLTETEKQQVIMLITGISAGTSQLANKAGSKAAQKIGQVYSRKWLTRVLPVIGVVASAGTNVLSTYVVGTRANAYFSQGPEAMQDWKASMRAITGIDERKIAVWLDETGEAIGETTTEVGKNISDGLKAGVGSVVAGAKSGLDGLSNIGKATGESVTNLGRNASEAIDNAVDDSKEQATALAQKTRRLLKREQAESEEIVAKDKSDDIDQADR